MMLVSLTSPGGRYDQKFLGNYSIINVKDVLARIKGMGQVEVFGASDYSMRIWVKPDRLAKLGISIPEVVDAIKSGEIQLVINTSIGGETRRDGYFIRRNALRYKIPYATTTAGGMAIYKAIEALRGNKTAVKTLQEYHSEIAKVGTQNLKLETGSRN